MSHSLAVGTNIDGKFTVRSILGAGGLGAVYKADQPELSRTVAIKVLHTPISNDPVGVARFEREARILASLEHEHIVSVFSFGMLEDGHPYMAMEHLQGRTLAEILSDETKLDWQRTVKIAIQICQGLAVAHKDGIIHRDLKPQNIMLLERPEPDYVKLLDFGLSKLISMDDASTIEHQKITQTGAIVGSVYYMSPEVGAGQQADERSDVYSLGCILYECLSGNLPFESDHPFQMLHKHRTQMPPPLRNDAQMPPQLEGIVFKALQKDPADRFQSMADFENALRLLQQGRVEELTLAGVSFTPKRTNKAMVAPITLSFILMGILGVGFLLNHQAHQKKQQIETQQPDLLKSERDLNIEQAQQLVNEAARLKAAGKYKAADQKLRQGIGILAHPYGRGNEKYALADLAVLESAVKVYDRLPDKRRGTKFHRTVDIIEMNDKGFLKPADLGRLLVAEAMISEAYDYTFDAIACLRFANAAFIEAGRMDQAKNVLPVMWELAKNSHSHEVKFYTNMAQAEYLMRVNPPEAKKYLDVAGDSIELAFPKNSSNKHMLLVQIYPLLQKTGQLERAKKTYEELISISLDRKTLTPQATLHTVDPAGRNMHELHYQEALGRLEQVRRLSSDPALKVLANKEVEEFRQRRDEYLRSYIEE